MASLWDDLESLVDAPAQAASQERGRGTIKPTGGFNAEKDAEALNKAIQGLGTNEKTLIQILTQRSLDQRMAICSAYSKITSKDLGEALKGDTSGDFEDVLVALVTPAAEFDCRAVMEATKGAGTKESILVEIFASRTNQEIKALSQVYLKETKKQLIDGLKKEVSGDFAEALLLLAQGNRDGGAGTDVERARDDAKTLYSAGEKKLGTDESKFIEILCKRSIPQLRQILIEYKNLSGKTLQQSIESEMSGDLKDLLVAVVKCAKNKPAFFAECLHDSMKGGGTTESTLTRIMVSRSEIDLLDIRTEFKKLYSHSLHSELESELSGDFGECMKAICGGDDQD